MEDRISRCIIIGAAEFSGIVGTIDTESDLLIAADGGMRHCMENNLVPDIWIGDADSMDEECLADYKGMIIRLPVEKDDTDVGAAVKIGMEKGIAQYEIYGALGGRMDHTIANIKILSYIAENGGRGFLYGKTQMLTVIKNSAIFFPKEASGNVGVFCLGDTCNGVTISGLKYELTDGVIMESDSFGCSNYFVGKESCILVKNGKLLITVS